MRELKYAILGLINRTPMTGYDITKYFDGVLYRFWDAKHSQIYPELKKLLDEDLLSYEVVIQGEKLEKKLYSITEKGKAELDSWLVADDSLPPIEKDAFRLRVYFADNMSKEQLTAVFNRQLIRRKLRLELQKTRSEELKAMMAMDSPPEPKESVYNEYMLGRGGIMRETAYIEWIRECAEILSLELDDPN